MDAVILQFKDVKGNSLISGFADGILLTSFSHGTLIPMGSDVAGTERTLGRPAFSEFACIKATDQSTQQNVDSTKKGSASFGWDLSANKAVNAA